MKTCPKCGNSYTDDLNFCLSDGTRLPEQSLSDLTNRPTESFVPATDIFNAKTIANTPKVTASPAKQFRLAAVEPSTKMGCALTIGQVAAGLLVVVGIGFAGIFFALRSGRDVAMLDRSPVPANKTAANSGSGYTGNSNISANSPVSPPVTASDTPRTTTANSNTKTVSGGVVNGKATNLPQPPYPPAARAVRATGSVSVQVLIDETGHVVSATAVSGHPLLRAAAVTAAQSATFSPTMLAGKAVRVSGVLTYNFTF